jgi:cysteine protease ATG4
MNDFERFGRTVVRTFYDPPPTNESNEAIWLLGQRYDSRPAPPKPTPSDTPSTDAPTPHAERTEDESWIRTSLDEKERKEAPNGEDPTQYGNWPSAFLDDFESRVWMTYRSGFAPIKKSQDPKATSAMSFRVRMQNLASPGFTSDAGFGCMIRSGQCILANALQILRLGRDWRWQEHQADQTHGEILSLFADDPQAPFSIHRFVEHGAAVCGKYPGEWFGPSAAARCIQDLVSKYKEAGLKVYVSGDGADVYEDKLKQIAIDDDGQWQPTLILVGTRLGIDKITPVYWEALKASLQIPQSIGIAGYVCISRSKDIPLSAPQRSSFGVTLLCWSSRQQLLLPRSTQHTPSPTLPGDVHGERERNMLFSSSAFGINKLIHISILRNLIDNDCSPSRFAIRHFRF